MILLQRSRCKKLGEGRDSATGVIANAQAAVEDLYMLSTLEHALHITCKSFRPMAFSCFLQESGGNVSYMTRKIASMKSQHCDRDFFRFVRLPIVPWPKSGLQA